MLSNMACSLIEHKRINTTVAKAKALRVFVEPILTKAKEDSTHNRRIAFSYLQSKEAVTELFRTVAPKSLTEMVVIQESSKLVSELVMLQILLLSSL
ncbi:hypothetical protein Lal_00015210 [Lupinus albus]|nr:hypothetical protein Lal_00015210 [Lupinus albus]